MSPHERMNQLDAAGTAYVITYLASAVEDYTHGTEWAVHGHTEEWLELSFEASPVFFVNMKHIASLGIKEL